VTAYRHTRADAVEALGELRARNGPLSGRTLTTGAFLERWVRDARDIRPSTRRGYEAAIVTHLVPAIGAVRLADLSPLHVETMLAELAPRMAPKTLRNVHVVLRRALGQAVRAGLVTRNVASREFVDPPKVVLQEPAALTSAEIKRLRAVLSGHPLEPHVTLALGTGLRQGEQLGLAWEDVDLDAGTLRVRRELARVDGHYEFAEPKTPRSKRTIPLAAPLVEVLRLHREQLVERGFLPTSTGPVFPNTQGGPLSGSWLTHAWYELLEQAGVGRRPWKILRATFGSQLFAAGVPDRSIADLLGHSRTHTTQRHYIATGATSATAIDAIEALVG
jgi:integrase